MEFIKLDLEFGANVDPNEATREFLDENGLDQIQYTIEQPEEKNEFSNVFNYMFVGPREQLEILVSIYCEEDPVEGQYDELINQIAELTPEDEEYFSMLQGAPNEVVEESLTESDDYWDEFETEDENDYIDDDEWPVAEGCEGKDCDEVELDEARSAEGEYGDYEELDIQQAVDTLSDQGWGMHTATNGGAAVVDPKNPENGKNKTLNMPKDEDEEMPGYFVFYGRDGVTMMNKAREVARRIKDKFGVDIIITPGDGMVEMEVPAAIELPLVPLDGKGKKSKKDKKVDILAF